MVSNFNKQDSPNQSPNPLSSILANTEQKSLNVNSTNTNLAKISQKLLKTPQLINLPNPLPSKRTASPQQSSLEISQHVSKLEQLNSQIATVQQVLTDLQNQKQAIIDKITGSVKSALSENNGPVDASGLVSALFAAQNGVFLNSQSSSSVSEPPAKRQAVSNNIPTTVASLIKNISPIGGKSEADSANSSNENMSTSTVSINRNIVNSTDILTNILKGSESTGNSAQSASPNSSNFTDGTSQISPNVPCNISMKSSNQSVPNVLQMLSNSSNNSIKTTTTSLQSLLELTKRQPVTTIFQQSDFQKHPNVINSTES